MAIDNQEKRMSAATAGRIWMRAVFPSGTIDEEERLSAGLAYGGNALTPAGGANVFEIFSSPVIEAA